jgi:tetratricopeptide (TPR) repeat protein
LIDTIRTAGLAGDPAQSLFESGRALASIGEWELAAEAFHQATLARPDFADAWAFLGEARQHVQDYSLNPVPPAELDKALSLDASSLSANTLMALFYQRHARFDQALEYLHKVTDLYPQNPALQVELGEALALSGDLEAALLAYQRAVDLASGDPAYHRLLAGFCIRHEYRLREIGLPAARQAVLLDPQGPDSLDVLGQVLFILGDLTSAERFYLRALEADPDHTSAHLHLGLAYMLQGERERARQEWSLVLSLAPGTPSADQAERLIKNYFP